MINGPADPLLGRLSARRAHPKTQTLSAEAILADCTMSFVRLLGVDSMDETIARDTPYEIAMNGGRSRRALRVPGKCPTLGCDRSAFRLYPDTNTARCMHCSTLWRPDTWYAAVHGLTPRQATWRLRRGSRGDPPRIPARGRMARRIAALLCRARRWPGSGKAHSYDRAVLTALLIIAGQQGRLDRVVATREMLVQLSGLSPQAEAAALVRLLDQGLVTVAAMGDDMWSAAYSLLSCESALFRTRGSQGTGMEEESEGRVWSSQGSQEMERVAEGWLGQGSQEPEEERRPCQGLAAAAGHDLFASGTLPRVEVRIEHGVGRKERRWIRRHGLPPICLAVLEVLSHLTRASGAELARQLGVAASTVTRALNRLLEAGLAARSGQGRWTQWSRVAEPAAPTPAAATAAALDRAAERLQTVGVIEERLARMATDVDFAQPAYQDRFAQPWATGQLAREADAADAPQLRDEQRQRRLAARRRFRARQAAERAEWAGEPASDREMSWQHRQQQVWDKKLNPAPPAPRRKLRWLVAKERRAAERLAQLGPLPVHSRPLDLAAVQRLLDDPGPGPIAPPPARVDPDGPSDFDLLEDIDMLAEMDPAA